MKYYTIIRKFDTWAGEYYLEIIITPEADIISFATYKEAQSYLKNNRKSILKFFENLRQN
ncbi:MAG: hypothetical protein RLY43_2475 [Bacteroidota bacterium]|jgi:hypothetical protein